MIANGFCSQKSLHFLTHSRWDRMSSAQRNVSQPIPRPKNFLWKTSVSRIPVWLFVRAADFQDQHRTQGRGKSNLSFQLGFQGKPQSLFQLKALPLALWPPSVLLRWLGSCFFDKPQLIYRGRQCFANRFQATSPSSFPERQTGFLFYWWGNWYSERQG